VQTVSLWQSLGMAFALVLVIEGLLPFVSPRSWRGAVISVAGLSDTVLRRTGLVSMVTGVALLYWIH
jgi:uncharacterized protein